MKNKIVFREGKRIYLRPISKEDVETIVTWVNDPEVVQFVTLSYPMNLEDEIDWWEKQRKEKQEGKSVHFAIVLKETDELIGSMGLCGINHKDGTATTGSMIGRKDLWGKGYGTEAKMLILEYAFSVLNLRKICASVYDFNPRSKRCMEKCGYKQEGLRKEQMWRVGRYADEFLMAVFRDDFLPLWEKFQKEKLS